MELGWGVAGHCVVPIQSWPTPYINGMPGYSTGMMGLPPGMWPQAQQYPTVVTMPLPPRRAATPPQIQHDEDTPEPPAKRQRVGNSFDWAPDFDTSLFELERQDPRTRLVAPPLLTPAPTPSPEQLAPEDLSITEAVDPLAHESDNVAESPSPDSYTAPSPKGEPEESTAPYLPKLEPISPPEPTEHRPDSPEEAREPLAPAQHYQITTLTSEASTAPHVLQPLQPPQLQPLHQPPQYSTDGQLHLQPAPHQESLHQPHHQQPSHLEQQPQTQPRPVSESVHLEQLGTVTISSAYPLMPHQQASHAGQLQAMPNEHNSSHHIAASHHSSPHHTTLQHPSHYANNPQRLGTIQEQQVIPITYVQVNQDNGQNVPVNEVSFRPSFAGEGLPEPPKRRMVRTLANCKYTREKNAECYICHKKYESKYKLKLHMYSHTGERPFVCEVCGIGFTRGPNLNAHRRVHSGAKPYPCTRCGRGFRHPSDRIVHMVTEVCTRVSRHVQATPGGWMCGACGEENFESEEQAERHARQHETGRAMACPVCLQNFKGCKAHRLVRHVREQHPEYITSLGL